jgi:hypothetical protein
MWLGPIVGSVSLAQVWKMDRYYATGEKPANYRVRAVSTLICSVLYFPAFLVLGDRGWPTALVMAALMGPASPLIWAVLIAIAPDNLARALRGDKRRWHRGEDDAWTEEQRQRRLPDTLHGDNTTLRDKILKRQRDG